MTADRPAVLFVFVHNAGRSQIAAGYLAAMTDGAVEIRSAGSEPADLVNLVAVQAMAEVGIDIAGNEPRITTEAVQDSDVVVTMGCGDTCPIFPGKRYEDWGVADPAGLPIEQVRAIRDDIRARGNSRSNGLGAGARREGLREPEPFDDAEALLVFSTAPTTSGHAG